MEPIGMEDNKPKIKRWSRTLTIISGFVVVLCVCAMLVEHHRMHTTAKTTISDRMVGDAKRLASILGYHYAQCRREVVTLAGNLTTAAAFTGTGHGQTVPPGSKKTDDIKKRLHQLLNDNHHDSRPFYRRIAIIDAEGEFLYNSQAPIPPRAASTRKDAIRSLAGQGNFHTFDNSILITARIKPDDTATGYIAAWLNGEAIFRQLTAYPTIPGHCYSMIDNSGQIIFPGALSDEVRRIGPDQLKGLSNGTVKRLTAPGKEGEELPAGYMAIALPVPQTPWKLLSIVPASEAIGGHHSWHYVMIVAVLSLTLLFFYFMQQRIDSKNKKLLNRYVNAQRQYRIMVQNNEDLANEILLRKRAESELKIVNDNLEDIVKHRTRKLKSALDDLQTTQSQLIQSGKLASIGELASGIAHELNQPLMVIRGNAQLMARMHKKSKLDPDQLLTFFDTIERNTKRMILIINHLRSFSRQSTNDFQSVDINQVINDAFLMIGEQMRLRNIETIKNLSEGLPYIKGDPYQLEQVFLNLLTNARDAIDSYHSEGNGYRSKKEIVITTRMKNGGSNMVEILFKDTGCGIASKDMDKIFDPFFTTKDVGKGTGLGLSISYGILQQHGGQLEFVDTSPGNTTLIVVLPAQ